MAKKQATRPELPTEKPQGAALPTLEPERQEIDDPMLPQKSLFRIDEAAAYFGVSERTIRLWIEHGHLSYEKIIGSIRIARASILVCRFRHKDNT